MARPKDLGSATTPLVYLQAMVAYTITLSLGRLKEDVVKHTLSAEDAAYAAWEICDNYGLDMPNRGIGV